LILAVAACATQPVRVKPAVALTSDEAAIYESVFRHQFERNGSATQQSATAFFIEIADSDPPDAFLARFHGETPPVKKASLALMGKHAAVIDRGKRGFALLFTAEKIRWVRKDVVEVSGGYAEGDLSASGNIYRVHRTRSGWKVVSEKMEWIAGQLHLTRRWS
jgi:hypothetical protein